MDMDKRAKECYDKLMAQLSDPEQKELLMNVWHDVWHMGHAKGWSNAKSVYGRRLEKALVILKQLGHEHYWRSHGTRMSDGKEWRQDECDCGAESEVCGGRRTMK